MILKYLHSISTAFGITSMAWQKPPLNQIY